ncbi:hypothetical protein AK88_05208 [Plasmodium fragile]|uniref:Schizont-infected cell agglutination C-terminal domain-containing protein n=1 Tax=Plasmodium fragile TaxID=5857 RepID=A0A0D9QDP1_PLAFR|nr:uncharacterized protein AK88_05208 [Plasmodium fragile]KJP85165.1 hypothetical protein AK88_05208 [Plasmodium fragile]
MCGYLGHQHNAQAVDLDIAHWLRGQGQMLDGIHTINADAPCTMKWAEYTKDKKQDDNPDKVDDTKITDIKKAETKIVDEAKRVIEKAKVAVEQEIEKQKAGTKPQAPPTTVPEVPEEPVPEEKGPPQGPGAERGDRARAETGASETVPAAASIPQPPPAAPPPSQSSSGSGSGTTVSKDTKETGKCSKGTETYTVKNAGAGVHGSTSSTSVSFGTTSDIDSTCGKKPEDSGPGKHGATGQGSLGSPSAPADAAPKVSDPQLPPTPTTTGTETTSNATPGPAPPDGKPIDSGALGATVVSGGNDDPPPLNPPKPKPASDNPDQAGASGSGGGGAGEPSSGGGADGVSGGEGKGGAAGGAPGGGGERGGSTGPSSTGHQTPASSTPGSTDTVNPGSSGTGSTGQTTNENVEPKETQEDKLPADAPITPSVPTGLRWADVKWYTPAIIPAVVGIGVIAFFLWKYFAYLAKRRRPYRTVRDVPSPPLDEEILQHLQRGERPPPDYGYTMVTDRQPASTSGRARPPRVHKRTIIELHLEVLNECETAAWENVNDDYWKIVVQQFAQDLMQNEDTNNNTLVVSTTTQALSGNNVSSTDSAGTDPCPPHEHDPDPWSCMENIQLATEPSASNAHDPDSWSSMETIQLQTDPCPPNEPDPDPWSCMKNIQLDAPYSRAPTVPGDATSACIHWIDRHKHLLRECTTQPWFLQLKADWKQYLHQHWTDAVSGNSELGERGNIPSVEMKKDAWKKWVARQHALMNTYSEQEWFQHLLNNVEQETESQKGEVPAVETDLEVENVMAAEHMLRMRDAPRTQLHQPPHMKKPLSANTWILILALVIEACELESSMQQKELYVDELLDKL